MSKAAAPMCSDAVILIPGIMGSELVNAETGTPIWGMSAKSYANLWMGGSLWEQLKVTDDERGGKTGRIKATGLLKAPAFAPLLRGLEPYTPLAAGLRSMVRHRDAVLEYPYDWRLPVAHNAAQLASVAGEHLKRWRAHPSGSSGAKLVLVAHSMGGLIARFFTEVLGGAAEVRQTIAIGTPHQGAVKAVFLLDGGRGAPLPLPRRRLSRLARTLPSVYDLLPSYRCVEEKGMARKLTPADIEGLGGDADLARDAAQLQQVLAQVPASGLYTIVGTDQPTLQSLELRDGVAEPQYYLHEDDGPIDWRGDGTVYVQVATGGVEPVSSLPQTHGALARSPETIAAVRAVLTRRRLGPPMGAVAVSLEVPESVAVNEPFDISVTSSGNGQSAKCRIVDADTGMPVARPFLVRRPATLTGTAQLPRPGLYRVEVKDGGFSAVSELVMVADTASLEPLRPG